MSKHWNHYAFLVLCIMLMFVATACFRDSAEGVGSQPVSQLITTNTPITLNVEETEEVVLEIEETEEVILEVEETEEVVLVVPTETATEEAVLVVPSNTPSATPDGTATQLALLSLPTSTLTIDPLFLRLTASATPTGGIVNVGNTIPGGTAVAQALTEEPPDNFSLTATALIGQLTQDAAAVATTQAFQAGIGTTPTPLATMTTNPLFASPTPLQPQALVPGADCVHQIRAGETLFKLSLAYGVGVQQMATASGILNPSLILVGQRVTIPGCGATGFTPPPTSVPVPTATPDLVTSDTTTNTAQSVVVTGSGGSTGTSDVLVQQAQQEILNNAQADIQANAVAQGAAPVTATRTYTVQQYDTLFQIAQQFGTTVDAIAVLNGITNINQITMGDVLQIP